MIGTELERLMALLGKLPGLGPRSARRVALHLIKKRETVLQPLVQALQAVDEKLLTCDVCYNIDVTSPCSICSDRGRDTHTLCVVEDIADLWAVERTRVFHGRYHVLDGVLSALAGVTPEQLHLPELVQRIQASDGMVREVILALPATVDGQTTAHYIADLLKPLDVAVSRLAHGVPLGGELDYLDEGTLSTALNARRQA